jgi:hypothetical protein
MAVTCNIASTFSATTPTGGYTNESSRDSSVDKAFVLDEDGVKVKLRAKKLYTRNVQISGKGAADYSVVAAGDFTAATFKATSAETSEHNDGEYIDFSVQGTVFSSPA